MKAKSKVTSILVLLAVAGLAWGAREFLGIDLLGGAGGSGGGSGGGNGTSTAVVDAPARETSTPPRVDRSTAAPRTEGATLRNDDALIARAFKDQRSDVLVETGGTVKRVLPDDNEGSRHQRFIVRLETGMTLLIAHNIDLAPRVPLREGDHVRFHGEYEWGEQGGVVHWTHHDPRGRHEGGWIEHEGRRYE